MSRLFILLQYLTPHHALSRAMGWLVRRRLLTRWLIRVFVRRYQVDLTEAAQERIEDYASFNDFFTRRLKADARPVATGPGVVVCPADGNISQYGAILESQLLQAKGKLYSLGDLLGGDEALARRFHNGSFATVYLAPRDYHRVHMPLTGTLERTIYVPGRLFSVNPVTTEAVPELFARNERLVCLFDSEAGPLAVILVGAMIVASIEVVWDGQVCPRPGPRRPVVTDFGDGSEPVRLETGAELGLFKLGSTVIVLFGAEAIALDKSLTAGDKVRMGQRLAVRTSDNAKKRGSRETNESG